MRHLNRSVLSPPDCLASYDYRTHVWENFGGDCKRKVRARLVELQGIPGVSNAEGAGEYGVICAYCEGHIRTRGHIEHFRRKNANHYPEFTFDWTNLFLSCDSASHCGHYKDRPAGAPYTPSELVKPDADDPALFFYFGSNGTIGERAGLSAADVHRARETIRVFNLNHGSLKAKRRRIAEDFFEKWKELEIEFGPLEAEESDEVAVLIQEFLESEWDVVQYEPYSSVTRELLKLED